MSSFNGLNVFGSGPHEVVVGPRGTQWATKVSLGVAEAGVQQLGDHQVMVTVHGRLTGTSASNLWSVADTLTGQCGSKADLIDDAGRTWTSITLLEVSWDGPPLVGRVWSVGYTATFVVV